MKTIILPVLAISLMLQGCVRETASNSGNTTQFPDSVDVFVDQHMEDLRIPGLALAVLKDSKIVKMEAYGMANLETGTPVTTESVFMIASLTKQFIAFAIVLLHEEGKLSLDDKITNYIVNAPATWKNISIRQLLSHTSGIDRDPQIYHPYTEQPITDVIESMYDRPLISEPGEKWLYSNVGYYILAEIISKVSGQSWDVFITEHILNHAGLTKTRVTSAKEIIPCRVSGYHNTENGRINTENWIAVRPSGGFLSTIEDLAKWDQFLANQDLLADSNFNFLISENHLNNNEVVEYGMGWYVHKFLNRTRIHHDGQYPGFRADYERFTDDDLTVIVLANSDNRGLAGMALKIAGLYEPKLATPVFSMESALTKYTVDLKEELLVEVQVKALDKDAFGCILEIEIWDENDKPVFKQQKYNEDFTMGEERVITFNWIPEERGNYSINVGIYGPGWAPGYAWEVNLATLEVK